MPEHRFSVEPPSRPSGPGVARPREVLVVDDEANIRFVLSELLRREGCKPIECTNGADAVELVKKRGFDAVIMDIRMPKMDGLTALKEMRAARPDLTVLLITAHGSNKTAVQALEHGAYDYFTKPFDINEVRVVLRRAIEKTRMLEELREIREQAVSRYSYDSIVGQSGAMRAVFDLIGRVIDNDVTVLITGESGTGKELIASAIHHNGPRASGPFIRVNTVAIPETLLESEMFGHERGSFTGAVQQKIGKVEAAHGGTLFLDEIGDMSLPLQGKLLRVLQEREIERVGSTKTVPVDIRVVCATNCDLGKMVDEGKFREDLYYRINVMPVYIPPLRERPEDIALLVDHFIEHYNPRLGKNIRGITRDALQRFLDYPWPGNVRELENLLQRTMLLAHGDVLTAEDLPPVLRGDASSDPGSARGHRAADATISHEVLEELDMESLLDTNSFDTPLSDRLSLINDHVERHLILAALEKTGGHRQESADLLGISRKSLHNKMVRYHLFDE
ncbi:MAG: two-component system, NtrC family, response regulator AtoC [Candidatus Sumerlaeota bacterium]|nr:two-component system, NtrC family, response regulator AtoC [Candidatus Sumerlaeota bacterium]